MSKVSVDAGLEGLKVISCREDRRRKRVPVSRCYRNKRIGECVRSIGIGSLGRFEANKMEVLCHLK